MQIWNKHSYVYLQIIVSSMHRCLTSICRLIILFHVKIASFGTRAGSDSHLTRRVYFWSNSCEIEGFSHICTDVVKKPVVSVWPTHSMEELKWDANLILFHYCADANIVYCVMQSKSTQTSSCPIRSPSQCEIYEQHMKSCDLRHFLSSGLLPSPRDHICVRKHFLRFLCTP